jgi:hypothetical protein
MTKQPERSTRASKKWRTLFVLTTFIHCIREQKREKTDA